MDQIGLVSRRFHMELQVQCITYNKTYTSKSEIYHFLFHKIYGLVKKDGDSEKIKTAKHTVAWRLVSVNDILYTIIIFCT